MLLLISILAITVTTVISILVVMIIAVTMKVIYFGWFLFFVCWWGGSPWHDRPSWSRGCLGLLGAATEAEPRGSSGPKGSENLV